MEQSYTEYDVESDRNITLVSSPETKQDWPTPPVYVPLYTTADLRKMSAYLSYPPGRWFELDEVEEIVSKYNQALSKVQFELWQCQGMKK